MDKILCTSRHFMLHTQSIGKKEFFMAYSKKLMLQCNMTIYETFLSFYTGHKRYSSFANLHA
jgi:hypothetical protein